MKEFYLSQYNSKIRYHDLHGENHAILFIHGLGCTSSFDYPNVAASNDLISHRRILIDLLGSGYSDRPQNFPYTVEIQAKTIVELIEHLEFKSVILYGHSMGGSIAIKVADLCKEKIKSLIISEANLDSGGGIFSKKIAAYSEEDYKRLGHIEIIKENKVNNNEKWAVGLEHSFSKAISREAKSLVEGETPSWREIFYKLEIPKTFIFGEKSLPDPDFEELKKNKINIEIVKDAGHSMAWENPGGLAKAIKSGMAKK